MAEDDLAKMSGGRKIDVAYETGGLVS